MGPIRSRGKPSAPARGEPDEDQDDDDLETDPDETPEEIARGVEVIEATFREPARDARRQA